MMEAMNQIPMDVVGIRLTGPDDSPVLLLRERDGDRMLPIWIASVDAASIAITLEGNDTLDRPLTHDLLASLVRTVAGDQETGGVFISDLEDGIYRAVLTAGDLSYDIRPSDGVALALRLGWPITCKRQLLDEVGVHAEETSGDEVERFRAFLDSVNADDFEEEPPSP